ncbi:MAG TPA: hypothetical protein VF748_03855 [Candidatus Acidoferrum sp.]
MYKALEGLVVEERGNCRGNGTGAEAGKKVWQPGKSVGTHFAEGMVGNFHLQTPRTWMDFVVSIFGHSVVVAVLILLPLYFTQAINMPQFQKTLLVAPPPPPSAPPRPTPVAHEGPYRVGGKVQAPRLIRQVQPEYPPLAKQARIQGSHLQASSMPTAE